MLMYSCTLKPGVTTTCVSEKKREGRREGERNEMGDMT
jgi:hypothetical protein